MDDIKLALLGNHEASKRLTDAGVLLPCMCGGKAGIVCRATATSSYISEYLSRPSDLIKSL